MDANQEPVEVPHLWGIRKKDIALLDNDYYALKGLFYGQNNIVIPEKMLDVLNPVEILAKYMGVNSLKSGNRHLADDAFPEFYSVIGLADSVAFPKLGRIKGYFNSRFSTESGAQRSRLASLDSVVRDAFMDSFFEKYKGPLNKDPKGFYDPNVDGRSCSIYVNSIFENLKRQWERYKGK